ncbi:MAG: heme lyase CcmF/NrfE family subunit [bacterium]|nr:heme lyase CcmF/NrfE family subunit [bacterium]
MTSVLGHILMVLAGGTALFQFLCPVSKIRTLASFAVLTFSFTCLTFLWLMWAYVTSDFSIINVALNSHTEKPFLYKIAGVWGNHEGSMLLWTLMTALMGLVAAFQSRSWGELLYGRTLKQMGGIVFFLLLFVATTSDPFWPMIPAAVEGAGLNPLLQDPLLAIHPPILYMGYGVMALLFCLSVSAASGQEQSKPLLLKLLYPWALVAWAFSTLGLILGSYWAYYQLGWGGWWFWDPVENASLLPWLSVAAAVHLLRNLKQGGQGSSAAFIASISGFSFALLSTFFVRSGMLSSVHSFADDGGRGLFLVGLLALLLLKAVRSFLKLRVQIPPPNPVAFFSRQGLIYCAAALFAVLLGITLLGIVYPLILDKGLGEKITVGEPYFLKTFVPIAWIGFVLAGFSLVVSWHKSSNLKKKVPVIVGLAAVSGFMAYNLLNGGGSFLEALPWGVWIPLFLLTMTGYGAFRLIKMQRWNALKGSSLGAVFGHLGIALCCIGMAIDRGTGQEKDVLLSPGESTYLKGLKLSMEEVDRGAQDNYLYERVVFSVRYRGKVYSPFFTEKRFFKAHKVLTTQVGRWRDGFSEVYIVPGPPAGDTDARAFRIQYRPWVYLIWGGGLLIVGALAFSAVAAFREKPSKRTLKNDQDDSLSSVAA